MHLGFEAIDNEASYLYWQIYARLARPGGPGTAILQVHQYVAEDPTWKDNDATFFDFVKTLPAVGEIKANFEQIQRYLKTSLAQHTQKIESLCQAIQDPEKRRKFEVDNLRHHACHSDITVGIDGFDEVIGQDSWISVALKSSSPRYVVYASSQPITQRRCEKGYIDELDQDIKDVREFMRESSLTQKAQFYLRHYADIMMTMGCVTSQDSISTTHMGIFRNPISFLDPQRRYAGISSLLHGFAALCGEKILGRQIQNNNPTKLMKELLIHLLPPETLIPLDKIPDNAQAHCFGSIGRKLVVRLQHMSPWYLTAHEAYMQTKEKVLPSTTTSPVLLLTDPGFEKPSVNSPSAPVNKAGIGQTKRNHLF